MDINARNVLSDEKYTETCLAPFQFDLQLFGHHGGKSGGKIAFTLLGAALGGWAGAVSSFAKNAVAGAILGASLTAAIWTATHPPSMNTGTESPDVQRFDRAQETMSSTAQIPVVYGLRKITGNQTFHETNAEANSLHKHVVLCEGGIEGIQTVTANDLLIPTGSQTANTVFTIQNTKYGDATVNLANKHLKLSANGTTHDIYLCNKSDAEAAGSYYEWQMSINSLISYINRMGDGWECFPNATTTKYPGDLRIGKYRGYEGTKWLSFDAIPSSGFKDLPKTDRDSRAMLVSVSPTKYLKTFTSNGLTYEPTFSKAGSLKNPSFSYEVYSSRVSIGSCYNSPVNFEADTVTGGTAYTYHDGDVPETYETTGGYPNLAWLDMTFNVNSELNGNPSVEAIIKGKKVYDTRTKKTEYSTNPAMCLRDFLLSRRYGLGRWITQDIIDEDSFAAVADYCDEVITFSNGDGTTTQAKRYELNMVIDEKQTALSWVQDILANFSGFLTFTNGKFKLRVEQQESISYKFNDDTIFDLTVSPLSLDDTPNKYDVKIIDPRNNWKSISCLCEDFADQKERGKVVTREVQLNGTTSQHQALRLARFYRDYNLTCPLQLSFSTGMQAMHLEPGDVVTVTYRKVWKDMPIRIAEIKESEDGKYEISGRQYNGDLYSDNIGGGTHWHNYSVSDNEVTKKAPLNPRNLQGTTERRRTEDGTTIYDIVLTYDLPTRYDSQTGLVYYKSNAISAENIGVFEEGVAADEAGFTKDWKYAGDAPYKFTLTNVRIGDIYQFKVLTKTTSGLVSDEDSAPTITVKVTAKATVPAKPYNLRYDFSSSFHFEWEDVADSDVVYYEVRLNEDIGMPNGMLGRVTTPKIDVKLSNREGTVYVYAVNAQKKYSYPASVKYTYPKPDAPEYVDYAEIPRGVNILLPPFPSSCSKAVLYLTSSKVSERLEIDNAVYPYSGEPNLYSVRAAYVDMIGEGNVSQEYMIEISPTFDPAWIEDGTISIEKIDNTLKDAVKDAQEAIPRLDGVDTRLDGVDSEILKVHGNITELQKQDGILQSTIAQATKDAQGREEQLASQITQTAKEIRSEVADYKTKNDANISQIKQNADAISTTVQNNKSETDLAISQLKQTANSISSTVQANKTATDTAISQLKQTDSSISTTVQNNKKDADGKIDGLSSRITQNANSITSIITNLKKAPKDTGYSAITQLLDAINLRVQKGDIINQINLTAQGTTIDGKYLHITGTTKIDNNLITGGMIKANAITADKLSASTIQLTNNQGLKGGSVLLNKDGLRVSNSNGSYVMHDGNGMGFYDKNGNRYAVVGRFMTGVADDNQYVKFNQPWDVVPNVMVMPTVMQTSVANIGNSNMFTKCYVSDLSNAGFRVRCFTTLGAGSSGVVGINQNISCSMSLDQAHATGDINRWSTRYKDSKTVSFSIPSTATQATFSMNWISNIQLGYTTKEGASADTRETVFHHSPWTVTINWLVNGAIKATDSCQTGAGVNRIFTRKLTFSQGASIAARLDFMSGETRGNSPATGRGSFVRSPVTFGQLSFSTATVDVTTDTVVAKGQAMFIVTDQSNKMYTVS